MRRILVVAFYVCFSGLCFALGIAFADISIVRHEISKDATGKIVKSIIGINYTNPVTGRVAYVDRVFTIGVGGDFPTVPTKLEVRAKIKEWLTTIPVNRDGIQGKSILQGMKEQTNPFVETFTAQKAGDVGSVVGEKIQEQ